MQYISAQQWDQFNQSMSNLFGVDYTPMAYEPMELDPSQYTPSPNKGLTQAPTRLGIAHTPEAKKKISDRMKGENHPMHGKKHDAATRAMISERTKQGMPKLPPRTDASKERLRQFNLSAPKVTCPHCGKQGHYANMARWHGDNCKLNPAK